MSKILVLNGNYYAGYNTEENVLIFAPERAKASVMIKAELDSVLRIIVDWSSDNLIEIKRIEILKSEPTEVVN